MNKTQIFVTVFGLLVLGTGALLLNMELNPTIETIVKTKVVHDTTAQEKLNKVLAQEEADGKLGQYAINAMYQSGAKDKLSDAKKQILARAIVRVANDIFDKEDNRRAFIAVIAIESGFQRFAQSPTGPKGLTQVARKAFFEAMANCGITNLHEDDVWDTDINLYAGACYFKKLLNDHKDDPYMAIIGYNQGPHSDSIKSYARDGSLENIEVLKYVAKFTFLKSSITDTKTLNVPTLNELPRPVSPK